MKKKENIEIKEGGFSDIDYISPAYVDKKNPKYINIDDLKYSGLLIINYNREQQDLILKKFNVSLQLRYTV